MIKTIVMYCDTGEVFPKYFILDGDYTWANNLIINSLAETKEEDEMQEALSHIIWDENGNPLVTMQDEFPLQEFLNNDATYFIKVGFYA
jgi:hypothetical protein